MRGDWEGAKDILQQVVTMRSDVDGPSIALIAYMRNRNFKAPAEWKGFHKFAEK